MRTQAQRARYFAQPHVRIMREGNPGQIRALLEDRKYVRRSKSSKPKEEDELDDELMADEDALSDD